MNSLFLILIGIIILVCIWLNNISSRIGIPTLLAFIVLGILVGNIGVIPIHLEDKLFAKNVCSIALAFIMFYGGFGTRWKSARPVVREASLLATLGVALTAGLTGLFCHYVLQWDWAESFLIGSVVSSTDAASVFSILRSKKLGLANNTAPMLEMESGSNDPMSYMLTALMLSILHGNASGAAVSWMLFSQIAFGAAIGFGIAKLALWALDNIQIKGDGYDSLFFLAVALISYALPSLIGGNGYLSVYLVGIMLGNSRIKGKKALVNFFDGVTGLMQVLIFFMLGLLARPALLHKAILPALGISMFMLLVSRPLSVAGILVPFRKYPFKQQVLVSFAGLRGAASIVFAIMATTENVVISQDVFSIVFCIVLISIALQGSLLPAAARGLDMVDEGNDVFKTFNDYSEDTEIQFSSIDITQGDAWDGKLVKDLNLPSSIILALIYRGSERIIPHGGTKILAGDKIALVTQSMADSNSQLVEKIVKKNGKRAGHAIKDVEGDGLILLIKRGDEEIFPTADTVLLEGDVLVLLRRKKEK